MQIERHLFRISERALKNDSAIFWTEKILYFFLILSLGFGLVFLFGHGYVLSHNTSLGSCLKLSGVELKNDILYYVSDDSFTSVQIDIYTSQGKVLYSGEECTVIQNKNYSGLDEGNLIFGWDEVAMYMPANKRTALSYTNITFSLQKVQNMRKVLFGFDVLIINQLLDSLGRQEKPLMIRSRIANIYHVFRETTTSMKVGYLFKVLVSFLVVSIVTSLYIYGTIVAAPAVILLLLRCCRFMRAEGMNDIFKLFPWIGIHAIIRETSPTPLIKASTGDICKGILYYFLFLYLVYYAAIIWIDKRLFETHTESGLQELIFGYVAMTEFAGVVFMRTRTFIKYFPSFHTLILVAVLYYAQVTDFGLKKMACYLGFSLGGALFSWMVLNLQIPAHTTWDQTNVNTPREDRPRIGYFPLFNMTWLKNLPDQWSMMVPLFGREHFAPRELALVDRNNQLLNEQLGNR